MPRFRILQIAVSTVLFALLTFAAVNFATEMCWRFVGGDVGLVVALLISVACLAALVGSIRLNIQILRSNKCYNSPPKSFLTHLFSLAFAIALLYIALERRSIAPLAYDSHLSTHYMDIELPDWPSLQLSPIDEAVTIQDYQILNLLGYLVGIGLLFMAKNVSPIIDSTDTRYNKVNPSLIKYQIASGIIFLFFALVCLSAFIEKWTGFRAALESDPALMNLSNLSGFGFQLLNFLLLLLYGQWFLRDGLKLRATVAKESTS